MRTKAAICIIVSAILLFSCKGKKVPQTEEVRVQAEIIARTKKALKNISIEKILIGNGSWSDGLAQSSYLFKKNGVVEYRTKMTRNKDFYWKVVDGGLYINPNNSLTNKTKFVLMTKIKAVAPIGFISLDELKIIKYSISFEDDAGKLCFNIHNYKI